MKKTDKVMGPPGYYGPTCPNCLNLLEIIGQLKMDITNLNENCLEQMTELSKNSSIMLQGFHDRANELLKENEKLNKEIKILQIIADIKK